MKYPLARQGVFKTIQGEGVLLGEPMVFIRLAGCSVGCPLCDTDYRVFRRLTTREIVAETDDVAGGARWAWITGGEPADHNLAPLVSRLREAGFYVAVATSGTKALAVDVDFLSVSPHGKPDGLAIKRGDSINLVPGLNGLRLADWERPVLGAFGVRYVTPCWTHQGERMDNVAECLAFIERNPGFRLGIQAHKFWNVQ